MPKCPEGVAKFCRFQSKSLSGSGAHPHRSPLSKSQDVAGFNPPADETAEEKKKCQISGIGHQRHLSAVFFFTFADGSCAVPLVSVAVEHPRTDQHVARIAFRHQDGALVSAHESSGIRRSDHVTSVCCRTKMTPKINSIKLIQSL